MNLPLRNIFAGLLALAVLISSSGVLLRKHYCSREGQEAISLEAVPLTENHSSCCDHRCCSVPAGSHEAAHQESEAPCCTDTFFFFKVPAFFSSGLVKIIPQVICCDVVCLESRELQADFVSLFVNSFDDRPPPFHFTGKAFLSFIQQFRFHLL